MADKLPPIYLPLLYGRLDTGDNELETVRAFTRRADAIIDSDCDGSDIAKYEPAVPRCKTCPLFKLREQLGNALAYHSDEAFCYRGPGDWTVVRADGSGYCSNHPEART